jgi:hypothetical protein
VKDKNNYVVVEKCPFKDEKQLINEFKYMITSSELSSSFPFGNPICIADEVTVMYPGGYGGIDLVLIDNEQTVTIVEAKLRKNQESKRELIGQLLTYITAVRLNPEEFLDRLVDKCSNGSITDETREIVLENLVQGNLRGLILSDEIRPIVKSIIEMLNNETQNLEFLGLEISRYCTTRSDVEILSSNIIGIPTTSEKKRKSKKIKWTLDKIQEYIKEIIDNDVLKKRLTYILNWAKENSILELSDRPTVNPIISVKSKLTNRKILRIYGHDGYIQVVFKDKGSNSLPEELKQNLIKEFIEYGFFDAEYFDTKPLSEIHDRKLEKRLDEFSEDEFNKLMDSIKKYALISKEA